MFSLQTHGEVPHGWIVSFKFEMLLVALSTPMPTQPPTPLALLCSGSREGQVSECRRFMHAGLSPAGLHGALQYMLTLTPIRICFVSGGQCSGYRTSSDALTPHLSSVALAKSLDISDLRA